MFERRLKIFLLGLLLATLVLLARAERIQVAHHADYDKKAAELAVVSIPTETTRGQILDAKGLVLAMDDPCTDACVDYRAIVDPPDKAWVEKMARAKFASQGGKGFSKLPIDRQKALEAEVCDQINKMWAMLASLDDTGSDAAGVDPQAAIKEIRQDIVNRVTMKRRAIWYQSFIKNRTKIADVPRWIKWLAGNSSDAPDQSNVPASLDDELKPHVILSNISPNAVNYLGKHLDDYPGLVLQPSTRRIYPMKEVACHIVGRLGRATPTEEAAVASSAWYKDKPYFAEDLCGQLGIEKLCEPILRGERGKVIVDKNDDNPARPMKEFVSGQDVRLTIDAQMQGEFQDMLKHVYPQYTHDPPEPAPGLNMQGSIVVLDMKTNNVLALASNPDFDANATAAQYAAMQADKLGAPLRDRATCDQFQPGSTVKPMVGLAAITSGVIGPTEGIECTGYLVLPVLGPDHQPVPGAKIREPRGRCWMASEYPPEKLLELTKDWEHPISSFAHHPIPVAHHGHDGNPDGFLTYSDALERSCNVYFETVADRLTWADTSGLYYWYDRFGFGRPTYIGIEEAAGFVPCKPGERHPPPAIQARMDRCLAGIGEGRVEATPLQIANEAATIARGGIRMRPHLLSAETQQALDDARGGPDPNAGPDVVDLHLNSTALEQERIGMVNVVYARSGTGTSIRRTDMIVAGKTGTADGARIFLPVIGQDGKPVLDKNGKHIMAPMTPAYPGGPPTDHDWYRTSDKGQTSVTHSWFMGYAPADHPQIAFCVLIEYCGEGGGNGVAGPVVKQVLEACVQHGYLHPTGPTTPVAALDN